MLTGCAVGPDYHRPAVQTPSTFRAPTAQPTPEAASLADLKWWEVFKDEKLQELIRTSLVENYDLRDAVTRVEAARANLGITRSDQFPNAEVGGNLTTTRLSRDGQLPLPASFVPSQNRTFGQATLNLLSFEVDIWGRLRRATEAARANLLGAEENRKAVVTTLVSDVATSYFSLRELDYELEISNETLATRQESLRLIQNRQGGGVATLLDLRQGEQLVDTAAETIPELARTDRANREPDQPAAREESRRSRPRTQPDRAGVATRSTYGLAFHFIGAPAGYPRGGAEPDRRQCRDRGCEGRVFSANQSERIPGWTKQRSCRASSAHQAACGL